MTPATNRLSIDWANVPSAMEVKAASWAAQARGVEVTNAVTPALPRPFAPKPFNPVRSVATRGELAKARTIAEKPREEGSTAQYIILADDCPQPHEIAAAMSLVEKAGVTTAQRHPRGWRVLPEYVRCLRRIGLVDFGSDTLTLHGRLVRKHFADAGSIKNSTNGAEA